MERNEYGYYIDVMKRTADQAPDEAVEIPELRVETVHGADITDKRTVTIATKVKLKDGDKISVKLTSRANGAGDKAKYSVDSVISLERVAVF